MKSFKTHVNEAKKGGFVDKAFKAAMAFGAASGVMAGAKVLSNRAAPAPAPQQPTRVVQTAPVQTRPVTQQVQTEPQKKAGYQFENEHVKKLYGALVSAEHRGNVKDPYAYDPAHYIRTRAGGGASSAYGPLQITRNTARGYADPKNKYHQDYVAQGNKFLSSHVKDATHGLGGKGSLHGEEHHGSYQDFAVHVMKGKAKELKLDITKPLSQKDLARFTQHWRHGSGTAKQPEKWYSSTVNKYYYGN